MSDSDRPNAALLKQILQPLLEDFHDWLSGARSLLETEEIHFLAATEQQNLLTRVKQAQQEVLATQALFNATDGQVGVEASALLPWHRLVAECWQVSRRFRAERSAAQGNNIL